MSWHPLTLGATEGIDALLPAVARRVLARRARLTDAGTSEHLRDVATLRGLFSARALLDRFDAPWALHRRDLDRYAMGWTPPPDDGINVPEWKCQQPLEPEGASTMQITTVGLDLAKKS